MANYISQVGVSLTQADEQKLQSKGFRKINVDLNKGAGGKHIYIWYKRGSVPITKVQFTFTDEMSVGLVNAGYTKIDKDLNDGADGDFIYLWYFRGSGEYNTPIVDIDVTTDVNADALKFKNDWERLACNLNRHAGGNWIHAWVKREKKTYICDVTATDSYGSDAEYFKMGYIRVDEDTNRGAGGSYVFIWYRQTTDSQRALSELNVSTDANEYQALQQQNYTPVSVNLNEGTGGNQVYLWYKKNQIQNPVKAITVLLNIDAVPVFEKAGVTVIERDLSTGTSGRTEYVCFYQ